MEKYFQLFYETTGVCTDTRSIQRDCLFIALKGENFNGNTFADQALLNGAKYVIVDEATYKTSDAIFLVENCLEFLQKLANYHRLKFNIPFIGITGSNGKTSTKELIAAVLRTTYKTLATKGNLNNHIGVPLTLLELTAEHEIAIIEMGANRFKDIEELCAICEPTHGIITNIGKAHLEGFGGFEGVLKTKKELYQAVEKKNGILIYNADDEVLVNNLPSDIKSISYGTSQTSSIKGELVKLSPYISLQYSSENYSSPILSMKMVGKYNFYNYLAAITFGKIFAIQYELINKALTEYQPDNNRSQVKEMENNTLILDCYNANPTSMLSALESFAMIDHEDKIAIIGDMLELGIESMKEHQAIIHFVEKNKLNCFTVGPLFKAIPSTYIEKQFKDCEEATTYFNSKPLTKKLILLKGSRGIGLERFEKVLN
ncbi:MAG: UDP-N-acetylmuramoyl-tripeptide--D-alanyl-D-alanine ligase [Crocinitomicaceae bacterium]|nr:UDP-N-acetylmuramoyl-tripeptide--D-alanyl-D-alanine ligase [Crocinitomicaceae bacterium]